MGNLVPVNWMEKKRVSTGIVGLDSVMEGGLPAGKSYLVTGEPGTGKSIFCIQFVLKGLLEGEKAVYVAVDEKAADIVEEAASLGWDLPKYVEERKLLILDASPYLSTRVRISSGRGVEVSKAVGDLAGYVKKMGASRVVIDPVRSLISFPDSIPHLQGHLRMLVHSLQDHMETTNLLTSHNSGGNPGEQGVEEHLVAGVIVLGVTRVQNQLTRTLLVRKMRGTAIDLTEHPFNIIKEKGITLA